MQVSAVEKIMHDPEVAPSCSSFLPLLTRTSAEFTSQFFSLARNDNRTTYLLSRLVVCDSCGHRYVGTAAKRANFTIIVVAPTLRAGKKTCAARLLNKTKRETAVLTKIQEEIL